MIIRKINSQQYTNVIHRNHIRYAVLGTGSSGNAYVFESDKALWMVDAGYKASIIIDRLRSLGFSLWKPLTIFCTHHHKDHILGVCELAEVHDALVVASEYLIHTLKLEFPRLRSWTVKANAHYSCSSIGGSFLTFHTMHDAKESLSYQLELHGIRFMILTDTGSVLPEMYRIAYYSHILFLEANYDQGLLEKGKYPPFLKRRIMGDRGHLSNTQAKNFLETIKHTPHLKQVFFCHLSDDNNRVDLVEQEIVTKKILPCPMYVCPKSIASDVYEVVLH
ncbi:MBL fold metallo-hydrolase [Entomospira nematocerorum]|uniref:MBL fold metallo-hydrolase n=1 Tax=Entomospira nematocerorum TaxID=2719987 RepID=A0A968GGZ6_9SPIO|nr:MBL fold metallo-hydrolase [Entomospira nematocera]NIZ46956.1 MBL fold metallo-hydrolase [Entomospira nematocera]WDI34498.1 MBL fold metallo-hydrolase [Entomospira nematocera]